MSEVSYQSNESRNPIHDLMLSKFGRLDNQEHSGSHGSNMLSINFSTPLAGVARSERIKQMTNNHPAFAKARVSQEILVKLQTSLRRMPGVSANESNEIISQLQEVGRIISQETSQLVDALMNLQLDQEDTDKAVARMSLEANLSKAGYDDKTQAMNNMREQLDKETEQRMSAEAEVAKVMEDLQILSHEYKAWKEKEGITGHASGSDGSNSDRDGLIKHLEETIKHLEGQVNNRRSLWAMKHPKPQEIARAIETLADSCEDKEAVRKSILSLGSEQKDEGGPKDPNRLSRVFNDMSIQSSRPPTAFQPSRPPTAGPPRYGPLQSGPPRALSTLPQDRKMQGIWAPTTPAQPRFGHLSGYPSNGSFTAQTQTYRRTPSRRGYQNNGNYRPNAPEFYPSGYQPLDKGFQRSDSFEQHRDYYPTTPSTGRGKYGSRLQDYARSPEYEYSHSNALIARAPSVGPLIHMTEMAVQAWNEQIMGLYAAIRHFVENNANEPCYMAPTDLSRAKIWPVLLATYAPLSEAEAISYLDYHLKEESSKSCLVTRVIIDFIVNRVWVPRAWSGASEDATQGLKSVEKDFDRTLGQPSSQRQPILDRQAVIIDSILKLDNYSGFSRVKAEGMADTILATIQPILNEETHPAALYRDIEPVCQMAWSLSSKILSSRLTFDFRFPEVGSRFSCQSMIPIWPNVDPMELQAKHWRVALVTTPVVTCRNDTGANISAHSVALADVVCMQ